MRRLILAALAATVLASTGVAAAEPGRLVIAGGALGRETAAVHRAMVERLGPEGRVAVIPAASGDPVQSAQAYIDTLAAFGVPAARIDVVHLAVRDDSATPAMDESTWASNANNPAEIAKIAAAAAIWFTGGDQARTTQVLLDSAGRDTPALIAIRQRLLAGATVGGTSAGAAIMSNPMIARGDSLAALTQPLLRGDESASTMDGGALMLAPGLGFFTGALVDQHFDRKARLGRLTRALVELPASQRLGFGIDEDTALIVDLATQTAVVAGAGGVTVVDARGATASMRAGRFAIRDVLLSTLAPGDQISLADLSITPATGRARLVPGREYYTHRAQSGAGMALPNPGLEEALGVELLDNRPSRRLDRVSFDADGVGVRYVFEETANSWGAYGADRYTISGVRFSIVPVRIQIRSPHP